jgi:hypothetical protein
MSLTFKEEQYNSDYGMITYIWGPLLWHFLHIISFNYPVDPCEFNIKNNLVEHQVENSYYYFIFLLQFILPCKTCRENLKKNLDSLNFFTHKAKIMKNRASFSRFIYNLHEVINKMLNKQSNLTYERVRDFYEHFRANCSDKNKKVNKSHLGCDKLEHNSSTRVKPKTVIYFVPFTKKIKTTKVHKNCKMKCVHN